MAKGGAKTNKTKVKPVTSNGTSESSSSSSSSINNNSSGSLLDPNVAMNDTIDVEPDEDVRPPPQQLTADSVMLSFIKFINEKYEGNIDQFLLDITKFKSAPAAEEGVLVDGDMILDITLTQLFESRLNGTEDEPTMKWLNSCKLPSNQAINCQFTPDLMGQNFEDLVGKAEKGKFNPTRKSFTAFLNKVAYFQCFIKPLHMSAFEWKSLEDLIINYVAGKIIQFMFAKRVVFKAEDTKRVRNSNGTYSVIASIRVKTVLTQQLKAALRKRASYVKNHVEIKIEEESEASGDDEDEESGDEKNEESGDEESGDEKSAKENEEVDEEEDEEDDTPIGERFGKKKVTAAKETTSETTPKSSERSPSRSSPRKRQVEDEVSDKGVTSSVKKVITTEPFPNAPHINYRYEYFNKVRENSGKAEAYKVKKNYKIDSNSSAAKNKKK